MNGVHGDNEAGFEQSFQQLQAVVQRLSEGSLTLAEALSSFEEGMQLADTCEKMLDEAELRVKQVSERAVRAGAEDLAALEETMRRTSNGDLDEVGLGIEIETYEQTIVFDVPASGSLPLSTTSNRAYSQMSGEKRGQPEAPPARPGTDELELDPLFDDE